MTEKPKVQWASAVWNRMSLPKHKFIAWIGIQSRLGTKDKLYQFNVMTDVVYVELKQKAMIICFSSVFTARICFSICSTGWE